MRRWHFFVMGFIALVFGLLSLAEYVLVSYGLMLGWLAFYPPEQVEWLTSLPNWVHGVWAAQAVLALVGALCLLAHLRPAVWMLGLSFIALLVLYVWALFVATPTLIALVGGGWLAWVTLGLVAALSFLVYLYARQEKQVGEVL
ncbi:hypothetical protein JANAI62_26320 [Jannaschia pagri]|uniref:Uncharacterized protein n=1 Tax=Jannaschia pagri TaxID=2829797 RepID=A0ABQ4NNN4_9RHOB|nr:MULTISPECIES: hypothetical protein [unclassified Jannaschia]GIT92174.1 hypothetical protein JANAI61_26320 [Jannaschia sp. AI_61]GIT96009.1 hypothetical protein JANAI62_26320 [Jannaschia sp. AI_62]